jgi:DNA-binding NarL/FixJ family response regulator
MAARTEITVLVVDDQPIYHDLVVGLLERDPDIVIVGVASRIDQALALVRAHHPHVVVMDQVLPDGHGTDAARRITRRHRSVRVVMLTATADERTYRAARKAGCSGFVTKDRVVYDILPAVKAASRGETVVPADGLTLFLGFEHRGG